MERGCIFCPVQSGSVLLLRLCKLCQPLPACRHYDKTPTCEDNVGHDTQWSAEVKDIAISDYPRMNNQVKHIQFVLFKIVPVWLGFGNLRGQ